MIEGFSVAPNVLVILILVSCFLSVLLNTARINSKYKNNEPIWRSNYLMRFSFGNTFRSLKERLYRTYFIALLLMMAAVNMQMVARSQLTYDITGSALYVGVVGAGFAPPILLLAIFGGSVSDQFNKKHILQISQLGMIILCAIIAFSIFLNVLTVEWFYITYLSFHFFFWLSTWESNWV